MKHTLLLLLLLPSVLLSSLVEKLNCSNLFFQSFKRGFGVCVLPAVMQDSPGTSGPLLYFIYFYFFYCRCLINGLSGCTYRQPHAACKSHITTAYTFLRMHPNVQRNSKIPLRPLLTIINKDNSHFSPCGSFKSCWLYLWSRWYTTRRTAVIFNPTLPPSGHTHTPHTCIWFCFPTLQAASPLTKNIEVKICGELSTVNPVLWICFYSHDCNCVKLWNKPLTVQKCIVNKNTDTNQILYCFIYLKPQPQ